MLLMPRGGRYAPAGGGSFAPAFDDWQIKDFGSDGTTDFDTFGSLTVTATGDVIVCITATLYDATDITGVTIGGNTVTEIASAADASRIIWIGRGTMSGATGDDVVVTTNAGGTNIFYERCCFVIDIDGAAASETGSATAVGGDSTSTIDVSVNTNADDVVLAFWHGYRFTGGVDVTWVGVTSNQEDNAITIASSTFQFAIADSGVVSATPRTVTGTPVSAQSTIVGAISIGAA